MTTGAPSFPRNSHWCYTDTFSDFWWVVGTENYPQSWDACCIWKGQENVNHSGTQFTTNKDRRSHDYCGLGEENHGGSSWQEVGTDEWNLVFLWYQCFPIPQRLSVRLRNEHIKRRGTCSLCSWVFQWSWLAWHPGTFPLPGCSSSWHEEKIILLKSLLLPFVLSSWVLS